MGKTGLTKAQKAALAKDGYLVEELPGLRGAYVTFYDQWGRPHTIPDNIVNRARYRRKGWSLTPPAQEPEQGPASTGTGPVQLPLF